MDLMTNSKLTRLQKGLHEAECLLMDRVPDRYNGKALKAVRDTMEMIDHMKLVDREEGVEPFQSECLIRGGWFDREAECCGVCGNNLRMKAKWCDVCGTKIKRKDLDEYVNSRELHESKQQGLH